MRLARSQAGLAAAALTTALILALALTGKKLGLPALGHVEGHGIVAATPAEIGAIEIRQGKERLAFQRKDKESWSFDGATPLDMPKDLSAHLETALRFMHVATPARVLDAAEFRGTDLGEYGLDPPELVVTMGGAGKAQAIADFGTLNPARTSQYARLLGESRLYLLPRHVGAEWLLAADMARRLLPADESRRGRPVAGLLLPASIDQVWAVEIVIDAKLSRFERDSDGNWFLHTGQHSHAGGANRHVADPAKAKIIAAALDGFGETQIESVAARQPSGSDAERFGLAHPALITLFYPRDSSTPLARIEIGKPTEDGFARYAQSARGGDIVTVASYQAQRLVDLVRAVGAPR